MGLTLAEISALRLREIDLNRAVILLRSVVGKPEGADDNETQRLPAVRPIPSRYLRRAPGEPSG